MTIDCSKCKIPVDVPVTDEQMADWQGGTLIQEAMPDLTATQREMLMTAICNDCWRKLFGPNKERT